MTRDAATILADTTLVVRQGPYRLAAWERSQRGAVSTALTTGEGQPGDAVVLIDDDKELSALLPAQRLAELPAPTSVTDDFALLTLDAVMPWDVLGVLALVSDALARAQVPAGAYAAYSRDHVIVPSAALERALDALAPLFARVSIVDR